MEKSNLLFVTQKIHESDDDLAFVTQWVDEFIKNGFSVQVICLELGDFDNRFPVFSLGKEKGYGKFHRIIRFFRFVLTKKYDYVFVHMNPEYFTLAGWWWWITRKPSFLWYTHYTMHIHLKLAGIFAKKMFAATAQSLPQYEGSSKKVVTGHGVDVSYWQSENQCDDPKKMIMVHRIMRSKRVELGIESLVHLPEEYTLTIYGRPVDTEYYAELQQLVEKNNLSNRVTFKGPVPMPELREIYSNYRIMINMAYETIDKTMLEAMCNGVFPVTTAANAKAIGLPTAPSEDTAKSIAKFVESVQTENYDQQDLVSIVDARHGLIRLIKTLSNSIKENEI